MTADDIDLGTDLARAGPAEARLVGDITADAFADDPFNLWLVGTRAGVRGIFLPLARHVYVPQGFCYHLGNDGACMWLLPGQHADFGFWALKKLQFNTLFRGTRGAVRRINHTVPAMEAAHPTFPHAYLFTIGVRPASQGKGLGRKLITPVLDACDRARLPVYLENSNPENTAFYRSCGFEQSADAIHPEPGSPPLVPMTRQPR